MVSTGPLQPRHGVTVRVPLDMEAPDRVTVPWPVEYDGVLSRSVVLVVPLLLLSAAGAVAGWVLARHAKEPEPGHPVLYAPPEGLGPVQAVYVATERVPDQALQATLLYQAEQGLTRLEQTDGDVWVVEGVATREQWKDTDWSPAPSAPASGSTGPASGSPPTAASRPARCSSTSRAASAP